MSKELRTRVQEYGRRNSEKYRGTTHWADCEDSHLHCFAGRLIKDLMLENAALETKIKEMIGNRESPPRGEE